MENNSEIKTKRVEKGTNKGKEKKIFIMF